MSTYSLNNTGIEINSAIGKVHNADTTPTQGSTNMVTSGGVFTALNNIGVSALPSTTEAQGITNYDNDDKIPTNAAVVDYVRANIPKSVKFALDGSLFSRTSSGNFNFHHITSDVQSLPQISYGVSGTNFNITIAQGTYYSLALEAYFFHSDSDGSPAQTFLIRNGDAEIARTTDSRASTSGNRTCFVQRSNFDIFYAGSGNIPYSFNFYWIEGDTATAKLTSATIRVDIYGNNTVTTV